MSNKQHLFSFNVSDDVVRKMNRQQYKVIHQWLRIARNAIEKRINMDEVFQAICDGCIYGTGVYYG